MIVSGSGTATGTGNDNVIIGNGASNTYDNSVCIGHDALGGGQDSVSIGWDAEVKAGKTRGIAIGAYSQSAEAYGVAIGGGGGNTQRCQASNMSAALGFRAKAMGYWAVATGGYANASGNNSAALGYGANATGTNATAVGNGASATQNKFALGNTSVNDLRCQDTSISAVSDSRDKSQIEDLTIGLDFVNAITPKAFYKNNRGQYYTPTWTPNELLEDPTRTQSYTFDQAAYDAATLKYNQREFGFIAQDVAGQLPDSYSDARVSFNETDPTHGFNVQHFTMGDMTPFWKALRELSDKHDQLQSDYDALLARVVALENA